MIVSPGSVANITTAINGMLRRLPAREEWFSIAGLFRTEGIPDMLASVP